MFLQTPHFPIQKITQNIGKKTTQINKETNSNSLHQKVSFPFVYMATDRPNKYNKKNKKYIHVFQKNFMTYLMYSAVELHPYKLQTRSVVTT